MKRATLILFWAHLLAFSCGTWAQAPQQQTPQAPEQRTPAEQQAPHEEELPWYLHWGVEGPGNDNPRGTTSLGMPLTAPLSPTAQHVSWGLGVSAGAGYNFNRRHALVGDFMWNWLYPAEQGLRPIQVALNTNLVKAHSNLFAFTGGYKLELRGRSLGTYFIVGGGWYYRTASLSKALPPGTPIPCSPALLWWGYDCSTGAVVGNLTEIHSNASALGVNGGVGLTFRVGAAPYRVFVESRYHFAPTKNVTTQLVTLTWGIRY
jgi:hypothetical protein